MKCSVCIATVRSATLKQAVASVLRQTWPDWELLILGQGGDPGVRDISQAAASADRRVRYLALPERGKSKALNVGIGASSGDVIVMTDDDCEARADWLETIVRCFQDDPAVGLVGGALVPPRKVRGGYAGIPVNLPEERLYDPLRSGQAPAGFCWIGGNVAMRRSVMERVGPFDEYLGPGGAFPNAEDTDYMFRMETLGVKMRSTPRSVVYHTYGYRYGVRACFLSARNSARGNGGLAGKLTLLGHPGGRKWLNMTRRECTVDWMLRPLPHRLPAKMSWLWNFSVAYRRCLNAYQADRERILLRPRA